MILSDYFYPVRDRTWDYAKQCGVKYGVIRLPEDGKFDYSLKSDWKTLYNRFIDFGITPLVLKPMPNELHNHIKAGDDKRDECIEKVISMFPIMSKFGINTICFNFMAYVGWCRTSNNLPERGGAKVTGFRLSDFTTNGASITEERLWDNYFYFLNAVLPYAEKYGIRLAIHPDDPPLAKLGDVSRIFVSYKNIERAGSTIKSDSIGVTMCQATYKIMGENLYDVIPKLKTKYFLFISETPPDRKQIPKKHFTTTVKSIWLIFCAFTATVELTSR